MSNNELMLADVSSLMLLVAILITGIIELKTLYALKKYDKEAVWKGYSLAENKFLKLTTYSVATHRILHRLLMYRIVAFIALFTLTKGFLLLDATLNTVLFLVATMCLQMHGVIRLLSRYRKVLENIDPKLYSGSEKIIALIVL